MTGEQDGCGCTVGRVADKYEMPNADSRLIEKWQSGTNVRQITEELN